jgi:Uma2 family endonuclease
LIHAADWVTYQKFLDAVGDRNVRITYDRGNLELMSPLPIHEIFKTWFGRFLDLLALELRICVKACGSTTFKKEELERGLEPDECFYLMSAAKVRDWGALDLEHDPPPDLAIEVDITSSYLDRLGIYAALKVPELWRFDGETLRVFKLGANGVYELCESSPSLPFLPMGELIPFLHQGAAATDDGEVLRSFLTWVRERVVPLWKGTVDGH